jgi:uncharacterized protein YggT (Ycf19 family)
MSLIDFILNLVALLLWFNWRTARFDPLAGSTPATLAGTLRRAGNAPFKNVHLPFAIVGLLFLRAVFYWQIGAAVRWTGTVDVTVVSIPFHCDLLKFKRMLLYSIYSFGVTLTVFHLWLLLLSILKSTTSSSDSLRQLLRVHLGRVETWPGWLKAFLPVIVLAPAWWLASWPLTYAGLLPDPATALRRLQQALLVGVGSYLCWKYLIVGVLGLYFVSSYVYFGRHAFWQHLNGIGRQLLAPLRRLPLRIGRVDFAPLIGIVIVFLFAHAAEQGVKSARRFDKNGVELPRRVQIPGLVDWYRRVSS